MTARTTCTPATGTRLAMLVAFTTAFASSGTAHAAPATGAPSPTSAGRVAWSTGYWAPNWKAASSIDWNAYTHVVHVQIEPTASGGLTTLYPGTQAALLAAAHAAGRKVHLGVGGSTSGSQFALIAATPSLRATFIGNLMEYLQASYGGERYDGVDLDYENPDSTGVSVADYVALYREVREALTRRDPSLGFTMPGGYWARRWFVPVTRYVDQFNVMVYYQDGLPANLPRSLRGLLADGVPPSKIGLGFGMDPSDCASPGNCEKDITANQCEAKAAYAVAKGHGGFQTWGMGRNPGATSACEAQLARYVRPARGR